MLKRISCFVNNWERSRDWGLEGKWLSLKIVSPDLEAVSDNIQRNAVQLPGASWRGTVSLQNVIGLASTRRQNAVVFRLLFTHQNSDFPFFPCYYRWVNSKEWQGSPADTKISNCKTPTGNVSFLPLSEQKARIGLTGLSILLLAFIEHDSLKLKIETLVFTDSLKAKHL